MKGRLVGDGDAQGHVQVRGIHAASMKGRPLRGRDRSAGPSPDRRWCLDEGPLAQGRRRHVGARQPRAGRASMKGYPFRGGDRVPILLIRSAVACRPQRDRLAGEGPPFRSVIASESLDRETDHAVGSALGGPAVRGADLPSRVHGRGHVEFVGDQGHLHGDAAQMASVWLCIVHQMACFGADGSPARC
jgi:hypothetical protein